MKKTILMLLLLALPAMGQVFNCSNNFVSNGGGSCGASLIGAGGDAFAIVGSGYNTAPFVSGGDVVLSPAGAGHSALALNYTTAVNVQAFTSSFTFQPNAWNLVFVLQNNTNTGSAGTTHNYFAGAGCEAGFYQGFGTSPPNYVFGLIIDQLNNLNGSTFQNSSVQIYQQAESPCNPNDSQPNYWVTNKISTSPVPGMNTPATSAGGSGGGGCFQTVSGTCDTYSAAITYDGSNFTLNLYDITAGGTCSPTTSGSCFSQTWTGVNIPSLVNGNTAWVGLTTGGSGTPNTNYNVVVDSFEYTVNTAPSTPSLMTYTTSAAMEGTATVANPTASPAAGSYSGAQTVTLSDSTSNSYICYALSATAPSIMPYPDNAGNCPNGTVYTSPITISSTQNLYYVAGISFTHGSAGALPSNVNEAAYTIGGGGAASTPTFSPVAGTYVGSQSVTISTASSGAIICYNTTGSPATNGSTGCSTGTLYSGTVSVSSSETLYAVAGGTGYTDSSVGSAAYTIKATTPTFSPVAGTYIGAQSVALSATLGSVICYNTTGSPATNGTTGCATGTHYTSPVTVSSTETLYAVAGGTGVSDSSVASAAYTIKANTPTFSPVAGTYPGTQSVTISATSGSVICYNTTGSPATNGSSGCTTGTLYSSPVTVSSSETLYAVAGGTGYSDSSVGSASYVVSSSSPAVISGKIVISGKTVLQ